MKKEQQVEIKQAVPKIMKVTITGSGDLILNKMNDVVTRELSDKQKGKGKSTEAPNEWEKVITSMHWRDGKPTDFTEDGLQDALKNNAPCITGFGLKKAFEEAVVRNNIDKYATKFRSTVNVVEQLIPIKFSQHYIYEKLMSPKRGAPVLTKLNRFTGWEAEFTVAFLDNNYSAEQILNIINLARFGGGIGSGRSSGYGRFSVTDVA